MKKTINKNLKNYQFSAWDIYDDFREVFILSFYSIEEAIEYAEEWQALNPLKSISSIQPID